VRLLVPDESRRHLECPAPSSSTESARNRPRVGVAPYRFFNGLLPMRFAVSLPWEPHRLLLDPFGQGLKLTNVSVRTVSVMCSRSLSTLVDGDVC